MGGTRGLHSSLGCFLRSHPKSFTRSHDRRQKHATLKKPWVELPAVISLFGSKISSGTMSAYRETRVAVTVTEKRPGRSTTCAFRWWLPVLLDCNAVEKWDGPYRTRAAYLRMHVNFYWARGVNLQCRLYKKKARGNGWQKSMICLEHWNSISYFVFFSKKNWSHRGWKRNTAIYICYVILKANIQHTPCKFFCLTSLSSWISVVLDSDRESMLQRLINGHTPKI